MYYYPGLYCIINKILPGLTLAALRVYFSCKATQENTQDVLTTQSKELYSSSAPRALDFCTELPGFLFMSFSNQEFPP